MNAKFSTFVAAHYILLTRCFCIIVGSFAVYWGSVEFPTFIRDASAERIAEKVIAGAPFKAGVLIRQLPIIEGIEKSTYCRPVALRSAAILRIRIMEAEAYDADHGRDEYVKSTNDALRHSLSCSPADPFLWLVLYQTNRSQSTQLADLKYLRMSYKVGPNEGWVASKRNWIAFENFGNLPPDLAEWSVDEFVGLVKSGFSERAAEIVNGPAWTVRNKLLPRLINVDKRQLNAFEYYLAKIRSGAGLPNNDGGSIHPLNK